MDDNLIDMENEFREKMLMDEIDNLKNEITKLKVLLKEAGVETGPEIISDEELICIKEISRLRKKSEGDEGQLSSSDIKDLDLLVKNLKLIRGENTRVGRKSKLEKMSTKDLMKELKK